MDLWVVAAATGAGYIAKHWQHLSVEKEGSTESYPLDKLQGQPEAYSSLQHLRDQNRSLHKLAQKNSPALDASFDRGEPDETLNSDLASGMLSTSGRFGNLTRSGDSTLLSLASGPSLLYDIESYGEGEDHTDEKEPQDKFIQTSSFRRFNRSKILKSRKPYGYKAKPLNSLESCLTAQLCREHAQLDDYVCSSLPSSSSSSSTLRPLLVTDGSRLSGRASNDPKRSTEIQRRSRQSFAKVRSRRMSSAYDRLSAKPFNSQGPPSGMLVLFLGIAMGITTTAIANKREVDKLNELLKQSENLVQDLHDELEMKDLLRVKELPGDEVNTPETNQLSFSNASCTTNCIQQECEASSEADHDKGGYCESMSNIEAELEAELERLELNMKASSLEKIYAFVELDDDILVNVVEGELRLNTMNRPPGDSSDSDRDASGPSTNYNDTSNYAVSPWELSLRLHELIQSRLEARILELETALRKSHKNLGSMEFECVLDPQQNLFSEVESYPTQEIQIFEDEGENDIHTPYVKNRYWEIINAYSEAYEDKDIPLMPNTLDHDKMTHDEDHNFRGEDKFDWEEQETKGPELNGICESDDDYDDEMSMLLIKQIVEKARQCSPSVLNTLTDAFD